jgi:hypothetical protein
MADEDDGEKLAREQVCGRDVKVQSHGGRGDMESPRESRTCPRLAFAAHRSSLLLAQSGYPTHTHGRVS